MFHSRIGTSDATPVALDEALGSVRLTLDMLRGFAIAERNDIAMHHLSHADAGRSLAASYAAANSITRRRFDAMLREAETTARVGLGLLSARAGRDDASTIAAARFLGSSIAKSLRRLENLLIPQAA